MLLRKKYYCNLLFGILLLLPLSRVSAAPKKGVSLPKEILSLLPPKKKYPQTKGSLLLEKLFRKDPRFNLMSYVPSQKETDLLIASFRKEVSFQLPKKLKETTDEQRLKALFYQASIFQLPKVLPTPQEELTQYFQSDPTFKIPKQARYVVSKDAISSPITYSAQESMVIHLPKKEMILHEDTLLQQEGMKVEAAQSIFNWNTNVLESTGKKDESGEVHGQPVFTQEDDKEEVKYNEEESKIGKVYLADKFMYHINSKHATANMLLSKHSEEAVVRSDKIRKDEKEDFYGYHTKYTTCRLAHPHFYMYAHKARFVDKKTIVSGPFNLHVGGVPTPIGFPFGVFKISEARASGLLFPKFGLNKDKGFYLKEFGYYYAMNNYMGLALQQDFDSKKGDLNLYGTFDYKKRYSFNGLLKYQWQDISTPLLKNRGKELHWEHFTAQEKKNQLTANVTIKSETFEKENSEIDKLKKKKKNELSYKDQEKIKKENKTTSTVTYRRKFRLIPYTIENSIDYVQERNESDDESKKVKKKKKPVPRMQDLTPSGSFSLHHNNFFQPKGTNKWHEGISFEHTTSYKNHIRNYDPDEKDEDGKAKDVKTTKPLLKNFKKLFKEGDYGVQHDFKISTPFHLFKHFNFTPYFNLTGKWYWKSMRYNEDERKMEKHDKVKFKQLWDYSWGAELDTKVQARYIPNNKEMRLQALQHQLKPELGFSYKPEFSKKRHGWHQVPIRHVDELKNEWVNIYNGTYSHPNREKKASLTMSLNSKIEVKVKEKEKKEDKENTEEEGEQPKKKKEKATINKITLLDNTIETGYDFFKNNYKKEKKGKDKKLECKLSDITITSKTLLFNNKLDLKLTNVFEGSAYVQNINYKPKNEYSPKYENTSDFAWSLGQGLGRMSRSEFSASYTFGNSSKNSFEMLYGKKAEDETDLLFKKDEDADLGASATDTKRYDKQKYVGFSVPWNLTLGYSYEHLYKPHKGKLETDKHSLTLGGNIQPTKNWEISLSNVVFNLRNRKLETKSAQITVKRTLHCWKFEFAWTLDTERPEFDFFVMVSAKSLKHLKYRNIGGF